MGGIEDPFLSIKAITSNLASALTYNNNLYDLNNLNNWYNAPINKDKSNIYYFNVPQLKFITAIMVKNLFVLLKTKIYPLFQTKNDLNPKFPKIYALNLDNIIKEKNSLPKYPEEKLEDIIQSLLIKINTFIEKNYIYSIFIDILIEYIRIFTLGDTTGAVASCLTNISKNLKKSYILSYPSVRELTYAETIFTMQAPFNTFILPTDINSLLIMEKSLEYDKNKRQNWLDTCKLGNYNTMYTGFSDPILYLKKYLNYTFYTNDSDSDSDSDSDRKTQYNSANVLAFVLYLTLYDYNGIQFLIHIPNNDTEKTRSNIYINIQNYLTNYRIRKLPNYNDTMTNNLEVLSHKIYNTYIDASHVYINEATDAHEALKSTSTNWTSFLIDYVCFNYYNRDYTEDRTPD